MSNEDSALNQAWSHLAAISENHWNRRVKHGENSPEAVEYRNKLLDSARKIEEDFNFGIDDPNDEQKIKRWLDHIQLDKGWSLPEWETGLGVDTDNSNDDILKNHYIPPRPIKTVAHTLTSEELMVFAMEVQGKTPEEIANFILNDLEKGNAD